MSDEYLRPPREYAEAGRALWTEVVTALNEDGAALDVLERQHLDGACRLADQAALIEAALKADPDLVLPGSKGQPVVNPLVTELRMYVAQIATSLARIKLPADEQGATSSPSRTISGRASALKRWGA